MAYIPWMVGLWGLRMVKNIILLGQGHWTPATRWFSIALHAANAVLAAVRYCKVRRLSTSIRRRSPSWRASTSLASPSRRLRDGFQFTVRLAIGIGLIASLVDMGKEMYQALVKKS